MPLPIRPRPAWARRLVALPLMAALAAAGCVAQPGLDEEVRFDPRVEVLPVPPGRVGAEEAWSGIRAAFEEAEARHPAPAPGPMDLVRHRVPALPLGRMRGAELLLPEPGVRRASTARLRDPATGEVFGDFRFAVASSARLYLLRAGPGVLTDGGRFPGGPLSEGSPDPERWVVLARGVSACWRPWSGGGPSPDAAPQYRPDETWACNGTILLQDAPARAWRGFHKLHALTGTPDTTMDYAGHTAMTAGWALPDRASAERLAVHLLSALPGLRPAEQPAAAPGAAAR